MFWPVTTVPARSRSLATTLRIRRLAALSGLLLSVAVLPAHAQDKGSLTGRVVDAKSGHALPFASVTVVETKQGVLTDSEGQYLLGSVPVGTYTVRVQFLGYRPEVKTGVVVAPGKPTSLKFELTEVVVAEVKAIEVSAERRLVEVRQGATIRSVSAAEIRNLGVQTLGQVLQQQAGITMDAEQIHVRGGRVDETLFMVNGVSNRDLVTGQSTAGQLNARSVAELNVATGAYDVRYGNALSGVVEVKLKEGGDHFEAGLTTTGGFSLRGQDDLDAYRRNAIGASPIRRRYGGQSAQLVLSGPSPFLLPSGLKAFKSFSSLVDVSGTFSPTRFPNIDGVAGGPRLKSSYEDGFLGWHFHYPEWLAPTEDNRWAARYALTWKPSNRDKWNFNFSKRIAIDQGFSRVFINATGDAGDPAYPWRWARNIAHAPTIFEDNVQTSLQWRRTLSATGFTELQYSRYLFAQRQDVMGKLWNQYEEPDDRGAFPDPEDTRRDDYFIDTGDDNTWQDRRTLTHDLQGSLVKRYRRHEVEVGFDHQFQSVQYLTIEDPWVYDPDGLGGAHDLWRVHPMVGALYLRDRLEYQGFTANIGMRTDYWFPGREVERALADTANANITPTTRENFHDHTSTFFGRHVKLKLSPRLIVAHPITEHSSFFFNYGVFTQIPSYRYVYSKLTSISSESFPLLGNPDLNPQVSINYELGGKHQFAPSAAANVTFFVKDIYDYPTATTFKRQEGLSLVDVFVYLNGHFARSKGFEVVLERRRTKYWSGKLSYTFQQTKGKSSDANEQKVVQENGGDAAETRLSETFVRWNRPHKLTANFDLRFAETAPWAWLKQSGLNIYVVGQSGRAYTPINLSSTQAAEPYSRNGIFQATVDVKLNRAVHFGRQKLDFGLVGVNVLGTRLVNRVDRVTGRGREWLKGEYDPDNFPDVNDYVRSSEVDDPSNYGARAEWRLSLDYDF